MDKLLKYNDAINEAAEKSAFKEISLIEAGTIFKKAFQDKIDIEHYLDNFRFYKGMNSSLQGASETSDAIMFTGYKKPRISPNADTNFYNIIFSNTDSWKDYPSRNKSLICTTSVWKAHEYGAAFVVVPLTLTTNIGVCPKNDIWLSFEKIGIHTLDNFNRAISWFAEDQDIDEYITSSSWPKTKKFLENLTIEYIKDTLKSHKSSPAVDNTSVFFENALRIMGRNKTLLEAINTLMAPKINNFSLAKFYKDKMTEDREVWFGENALLLDVSKIKSNIDLFK